MKRKIRLISKLPFTFRIAKRLSNYSYYQAYGKDIRYLPLREAEKKKYRSGRCEIVSRIFKKYKDLCFQQQRGYQNILKGIYDTNKKAAEQGLPPPVHTNLYSLVGSVPMLISSYRTIRANKGATTLGAMLSTHRLKTKTSLQRAFLKDTLRMPDGISYQIFCTTAKLLKEGRYPWGASRRVYIDKPQKPGQKRPVTIPPFMDRVVQTSILRVLEAIYEPWFAIQNRSFGFRPRRGVHDAIYSLIRTENKGLFMAIEGDIKGAYDNTDRDKLLSVISNRITDRKFINLLKDRLNIQVYDTEKRAYIEEYKGIPQGGIDSPTLWNIYMYEFDQFITKYLDTTLSQLNSASRGNNKKSSKIVTKDLASLNNSRRTLRGITSILNKCTPSGDLLALYRPLNNAQIAAIKKYLGLDSSPIIRTRYGLCIPKAIKYALIKRSRLLAHRQRRIPSSDPNRRSLRYHYVRYADDWIIIGNFDRLFAEKLRTVISDWLLDNLKARLELDKTLITDMRKDPAHFLGFELRTSLSTKLSYKRAGNTPRPVLTRVAGTEIKAYPDAQRLIDRLHMKGFCTKLGKPKPMSWLSTLETHALITRFNAVLSGFGNFYYGYVPKSSLNRWIYIIRFCLFKTLAQKYDTNIKGIFNKFGIRSENGNTIKYTVKNTFVKKGKEKVYRKEWVLYTEKDIALRAASSCDFEFIKKRFNTIEYDRVLPPQKSKDIKFPVISDDDYVDRIYHVNLRTQASFDLPCCICGSFQQVQMHHIKHVRKRAYTDIPESTPWIKVMALRNRKQIPVCRDCHLNKIHRGKYDGPNLRYLAPRGTGFVDFYDLRVVVSESFINKRGGEFFGKSLEEKGWLPE